MKCSVQTAVRRLGRTGEALTGAEGASAESDAGSHNNSAIGEYQPPPSSPLKAAHESAEKESVKELRAAKTREILEKIRNAKAQSGAK